MPEITSVEAVSTKLREFDERMDDAIAAARSLARIRTDAEKLHQDVGGLSGRAEKEFEKMRGVRKNLSQLQTEWTSLRQEVHNALAQSKAACQQFQEANAAAVQSVDAKVLEVEKRVIGAWSAQFTDQVEFLKSLDADATASANRADRARDAAAESASQLQQIVESLRDELESKVHDELTAIYGALDSDLETMRQQLDARAGAAFDTLEQRAATIDGGLRAQMAAFREEIQGALAQQRSALESHVTDFLNKQNALVQNLAQQIDSYQRAAEARDAEATRMRAQLAELASAQRAERAVTAKELGSIRAELDKLRDASKEVASQLQEEGEARRSTDATARAISKRLDETIGRLADVPWIGSKFK